MILVKEAAEREFLRPVAAEELMSEEVRAVAATMTFACATDGNHGRSVAQGAQLMGAKAKIFVHSGVSEARIEAIARFGAEMIRVSGNYDDSVAISGTAFTWYAGAAFVSRPERLPAPIGTPRRRALLGAGAIVLGLLAVPLSLVAAVPVVAVATVWVVGGFGMGVLSSTSVTEVLRRSRSGREAGHSAALQTSDSVAESVALALGGTVFAAAVVHGLGVGVLAAFAVPTACVVAGLLVLGRGYER